MRNPERFRSSASPIGDQSILSRLKCQDPKHNQLGRTASVCCLAFRDYCISDTCPPVINHCGAVKLISKVQRKGSQLTIKIPLTHNCLPAHHQSAVTFLRLSELPIIDRGSAVLAHTGVGLRGMQERLRQLGGTLQIQSNGHGTQVIATLRTRHHAADLMPPSSK